MAKILLVEDDSNLREIYGARLEAEGYQIVAASDGEEALATAVKELPDLIISDIMMPKISGFDMLDILRSTPETKDVKVIVMTALSQEEDKKRGEELGADRYVVKSQVTLDDIVSMVHDLLGGGASATNPVTTTSTASDITVASDDDAIQPDDTSAVTAVTPFPTSDTIQSKPTLTPAPADPSISSSDAATLDQEVEQFVATSPLMNGTAPLPAQNNSSDEVDSENEPTAQPPIQPQTPAVS